MAFPPLSLQSLALGGLLLLGASPARAVTLRMDDILDQRKAALGKVSAATVSQAVESAMKGLKKGDALVLPFKYDLGEVKVPLLPEDVQIIGGKNGRMELQGDYRNVLFFGQSDVDIGTAAGLGKTGAGAGAGLSMANTYFIATEGKGVYNNAALDNTYWIDHIGNLKIVGTMTNSTGVWMRYNNEGKGTISDEASMHYSLNGTGQNVKMLMFVEHNQNNQKPGVFVENAKGMVFAHGSTESGMGNKVGYKLKNCEGVHLAQRRFFHGHAGQPTKWGYGVFPRISLQVEGGKGNILDGIVDLGNPKDTSLLSTDPDLRTWSTLWEDKVFFNLDPSKKVLLASMVPQAMVKEDYKWTEPRMIFQEVVFSLRSGTDTVDFTKPNPVMPAGWKLPVPPAMPKCDIPKPPELLYKKSAGFGSALLAAGADPTGRRASDAAFAQVLAEKNVLEIPAGTFRLDAPLVINPSRLKETGNFNGNRFWVMGAGENATRIVGRSGALVVLGDENEKPLAKSSDIGQTSRTLAGLFSDLKFEGGEVGVTIPSATYTAFNNIFKNCTFSGQTRAGVEIASAEPEQNRFISCTFKNTGEYGIRMATYADKYLFYRCHFEGQTKGGIYTTRIAHFHAGVYQCSFKNIGGPGVSVGGGNDQYGYGPWIFTIDNSTFEECGNATEPAVNMGNSWLAVLSHSTIKTKSKPILAGVQGMFFSIDNVSIDVGDANSQSMLLGHQRWEKTAGVGLSRMTNVYANGKISFMKRNEWLKDAYYSPTLYSDRPWAFTYLLYKVKSANLNPDYALYKEDGSLAVDLSSFPREADIAPQIQVSLNPGLSKNKLQGLGSDKFAPSYDLQGRRLPSSVRKAPKGIYLEKVGGEARKAVKL